MVVGFSLAGISSASKSLHGKCPQYCSCPSSRTVKCNNKALAKVPSDISNSVLSLDLSGNPALKIHKTSFVKFGVLKSLILDHCNLNKAFIVPHKLSHIKLGENKLSYGQFYAMLSTASSFLRDISVPRNKIHIIHRQQLLNTTNLKLKSLNIKGNFMNTIYNETFDGFHYLRKLDLRNVGIETIKKDAFHHLLNLRHLYLAGNRLTALPSNLFEPLMKLTVLRLDRNKLREVPGLSGLPRLMTEINLGYNYITDISILSEMGVESVTSLTLWNNNITILPQHVFQTVSALSINLAFNKLREIQGYSFTACTYVYDLYLDSNELLSISEKAFSAVQFMVRLFLSNNKLQVIPSKLFSNLSMGLIFLHNNNISSMEYAWKYIRNPPKLILLFENPIRILTTDGLQGLGNYTNVHISCETLSEISGLQKLKPIVRCSPSQSFYVIIPDSASVQVLQRSGFDCKRLSVNLASLNQYANICTPCLLGHYGIKYDGENDNLCQTCPAGSFYQDKLVQTSCKRCPVGQYVPTENAPGKGPLDCKTCPRGTQVSKYAGYRACLCLPGFARLNRFGPCTKCTTQGILCEGDYRMLKPGFWWSWEYNATCKTMYQAFVENLQIFNESYSKDTCVFNCKMPLPYKCPIKVACQGTVQGSCHQNYMGPLCTLCAMKYYKHFNTCVRCPEPWIAVLKVLAYLLAFVVICALINWADKIVVDTEDETTFVENSTNMMVAGQQIRKHRTFADIILSTLKIVLGFYQVLNGTVHSLRYTPWPKPLLTALRLFKYIELEVLCIPSLNCIKPEWRLNAIDEFCLSLGITLLVPLLIGTYYTIRKSYLNKAMHTQRYYIERVDTCKKQCLRSIILFLFITFPSTSRRIFQILPLACHKLCLTASEYCISYMRADYSVKCLSSSSQIYWVLYTAYASLIIPFGFVTFLLVSFAQVKPSKQLGGNFGMNSDNIYPLAAITEHHQSCILHPTGRTLKKLKQESTFQFALKFCLENYNPCCWYWEITEILRKFIFISILPLLVPFSNIFLGLSILLAGLFALLHAYKRPIHNYFENWLQMLSLSIIPANLCIAYILDTTSTQHSILFDMKEEKLGISVILITLNSAVIIIIMLRIARAQVRKLQQL